MIDDGGGVGMDISALKSVFKLVAREYEVKTAVAKQLFTLATG